MIGAGTLAPGCPQTFYRDLTIAATDFETPVLIDCAGEPLLASLPACPAIVKMNQEEFGLAFGVAPQSLEGWIAEAHRVYRAHEIGAEGDDWSASLRWAGAVSAAVVPTEGTADCHTADVERIHGDVVVSELNVG